VASLTSFKTRLFLILFFLGFLGVVSVLLIDMSALVSLVSAEARGDVPPITPALKIVSLIQPTVLVGIAVLIGVILAPRVGLSAPVSEAVAAGERTFKPLVPQLIPGLLGGLIGGVLIVLTTAVFKPLLGTQTIERVSKFGSLVPLPTRLLYGGVTEEVLLRWGFMTLVVWAAWRLFQRRLAGPTSGCLIVAIVISAFVFGVGHLPIAVFLLPKITLPIVLFVIIANSIFGVIAGYLYWKRGLESAMIGHMLCHVVLATASYAGAYF
jgi:hypothetical protein